MVYYFLLEYIFCVKYLAACSLNRIWTVPVSYSKCLWRSVGTHNALRLWVCPWGFKRVYEVLSMPLGYPRLLWCSLVSGHWGLLGKPDSKILAVGRCQRGCQHGQLRSRGNPQWIPTAARITATAASIFSLSIHQSLSISLSFPFPNLLFLSFSFLSLFSSPFSIFYAFCLSSNSHLVFSLQPSSNFSPSLERVPACWNRGGAPFSRWNISSALIPLP